MLKSLVDRIQRTGFTRDAGSSSDQNRRSWHTSYRNFATTWDRHPKVSPISSTRMPRVLTLQTNSTIFCHWQWAQGAVHSVRHRCHWSGLFGRLIPGLQIHLYVEEHQRKRHWDMSPTKPHPQRIWFRYWDAACHFQSRVQAHSFDGHHYHWVPSLLFTSQRLVPCHCKQQQQLLIRWTRHTGAETRALTSTCVDQTTRRISAHLLWDVLRLRHQCLHHSQVRALQHTSHHFSDIGQGCRNHGAAIVRTGSACPIPTQHDAHGKERMRCHKSAYWHCNDTYSQPNPRTQR